MGVIAGTSHARVWHGNVCVRWKRKRHWLWSVGLALLASTIGVITLVGVLSYGAR